MGNSQNSIDIYLISIAIPISLCPSMMYFDIQAIHLISHPSLHGFVQPDLFFLTLLSGTNPIVAQPFWYYLSHSRLFCLTCLLPFQFLHSDFCPALFFCLFLHIFLYSGSPSPSFRSHFQPSLDNQLSSLSQLLVQSVLSQQAVYSGCIYRMSGRYSWPLTNLPELFYCFPILFYFLFSVYLLKQSFLGWLFLEVILPQSADSQASSIFLTNFLSLAQPIFLFINSYFHVPTQSQYHQIACSVFSSLFTSIRHLVFCLHLNPVTSCAHFECQQEDSLEEGCSSYRVAFP